MHVAEDVVDMVETAAEEVDKVAEEIADHLPKDSILQKTAVLVENAAETVAKDANLAAEIIGKVSPFLLTFSSLFLSSQPYFIDIFIKILYFYKIYLKYRLNFKIYIERASETDRVVSARGAIPSNFLEGRI